MSSKRVTIALLAAIGVLVLTSVALAVRVAGEDARTAESVCRTSLLSITPSTHFVEAFTVRNLASVDTSAEPQVEEAVKNHAKVKGPHSTFVVEGDVRFGKGEPTAITCLVDIEGGTVKAAPTFALPVQ